MPVIWLTNGYETIWNIFLTSFGLGSWTSLIRPSENINTDTLPHNDHVQTNERNVAYTFKRLLFYFTLFHLYFYTSYGSTGYEWVSYRLSLFVATVCSVSLAASLRFSPFLQHFRQQGVTWQTDRVDRHMVTWQSILSYLIFLFNTF